MRHFLLFLFAAAAAAAPIPAQPGTSGFTEPRVAPAPDWVERVAVPAPDPALSDRPAQLLLSNSQSRYESDAIEHFVEFAFLIQNSQGLQGVGNVVIPWQPDQSELIVHSARILRGGAAIDLLAGGHQFTVLRRENNLEAAVLDGTLTAVMQPEGLAVGDILALSWTIRRRPGALPLRAENFFSLGPQPIRRLSIRQIWPESLPVEWRATGAFEAASLRTARRRRELRVELENAEAPQPPAMVPTRLLIHPALEISGYRDWREISAILAPHYETAQRLAPDSPLHAEIERLGAEAADPRRRAMAALRLVQDQVRYLALVMGDGNYLPPTADQTWARRYADCKGKTALLLALLHGLGIEAVPVLVNTEAGDALDERLPMMALFNHVLVRATIDGRVYWLDGTRTGDRNLDDLASSLFGWGLPVREGGADLEPLPFISPPRPLGEMVLEYDGSRGLGGAVPLRMESIARGDLATQMRQLVSQIGRETFLQQMRSGFSAAPAGIRIEDVVLRDEEESGTFALVFTGEATLDWNPVPGTAPDGGPRRYLFANDVFFAGTIAADRPEGPFKHAPVALPVPLYAAVTETVILPRDGRGFRVEGEQLDEVVAGTRFTRRFELSGGRATVRTEVRRLEREVPAEEAREADARIRRLSEDRVQLLAPPGAVRERQDEREE